MGCARGAGQQRVRLRRGLPPLHALPGAVVVPEEDRLLLQEGAQGLQGRGARVERAEKKLYCCKTANKGCPSELPPPSGLPPSNAPPEPDNSVYDCDAGYHHCMHCLELSWSPKKIDYCCKKEHKGCKGEEPE